MQVTEQFNEIFELEQKIRDLKDKQRQEALAHVKKIIATFEFTTDSLVDSKQYNHRNGSTALCRQIFAENPGISNREYMELTTAKGVNKGTAAGQLTKLKKKMDSSSKEKN